MTGKTRLLILFLAAAAAGSVVAWRLTGRAGETADPPQRVPNQWNSPVPRYLKKNKRLPPPAPGRPRVVFLGDSIAEHWPLEEDLAGPGLEPVNRGIAGQTTRQLLLRLRQDALALSPSVVVLLGGTNDAAYGLSGGQTVDHLETMARAARAAGTCVVVGTFWSPGTAGTRRVNDTIKGYCAPATCAVADFEGALCPDGACASRNFVDGVHPSRAGYRKMAEVVRRVLKEPSFKKRCGFAR